MALIQQTVSSDNLALNFVNSDEVECELSSTGPANFQIFMVCNTFSLGPHASPTSALKPTK
jgi:hypothetical protein